MKTVFVETSQFNQMISYKPYAATRTEKKKVKYSLLERIKDKIGDRWNLFKEGTRQTFDMICFFGAELGFFYAGDDYLAARHEISTKTIRNRFKELEELGQVIKVYRRAKRCNGRGKPVYLFVNHAYFNYWVELLGLNLNDFHTDFQTENTEIPSGSKKESQKKIPTYSLPKKQENNISISDSNKIVQYVVNRVQDTVNKGITVKYLSSYINRVVSSLEKQAIYAENNRLNAKKKQIQEELSTNAMNILGIKKRKPVPLYNWLEQ